MIPKDVSIAVLNIGTAVLVRDVMDQYLRSLGDIRTYYASNLDFALQTFSERHLDLIFCELTFPGGSAEEFIRKIGGLDVTDNLYFVVCTGRDMTHAKALASEFNADYVLEAPFSANDVTLCVDNALMKRERDRSGWIDHLLEAKLAAKNMRTQEAKILYKELVKNNPQNEDVLISASRFYLQLADYESANQAIESCLAFNPNSLRAKSLHGMLSLKRGDYTDGLKMLEELQSSSPLNTTRSNEIATAYVLLAIRQARRAIEISDACVPAILNCIKFQTALGRYPDVINTYQRYKDRLLGEEKREAEYFVALSKKLGNIV